MADFLHFLNNTSGIKISAVTSDGFRLTSQSFKTESLTEASGLNAVYDYRFPKPALDADTLNYRSGHFYLDRANHSGSVVSTTDASTLALKSGHYYLDRTNHSGTVNATQFNGSGAHYFLDRANFSGNVNNQSVYFSGLSYSVSSGVDYNDSFRSGNYTINWASANLHSITLSGATTLVFSGGLTGSRLQLMINQDSVGSRLITWPSNVKWPAGTAPTLTTTQSGIDIAAFYCNNNQYYGTTALDFR